MMVWLGHILRMDSDRLVRKAVRVQYDMGRKGGNLFLDAPTNHTFDQLVLLAKERDEWSGLVKRTFE